MLKMLALGSMVSRSRILIGHAAFKSRDLSQENPTAPLGTEARAGICQANVDMSELVITPPFTTAAPAGVSVPADVLL
jgi:hypothetical protein